MFARTAQRLHWIGERALSLCTLPCSRRYQRPSLLYTAEDSGFPDASSFSPVATQCLRRLGGLFPFS